MPIGASTSNRKNASNGHLLAVFLLVYRFVHVVKKQWRICLIIRVLPFTVNTYVKKQSYRS